MKNLAAVELGRKGGLATKKKHGKKFYSKIGIRGRAKQLATTESELRLQANQHNKRMIKSLDRAAKQLSTSKE